MANATRTEQKARISEEIEALEQMVSEAPEGHPAKVATAELKAFLPRADAHWMRHYGHLSAREVANYRAAEVAKGVALERSKVLSTLEDGLD